MKISCPTCKETFSVQGNPPKFCSQCGAPLSQADLRLDDNSPTVPPNSSSDEMATVPPSGDSRPTDPHLPKTLADASSAAAAASSAASTIGPYTICRKLGQGGMGSVFEAENQINGKRVALKILSRALLSTDDSIDRFKRESQIAASINHPRSTFVYEAGECDDQFFITMELMTGGTLRELVQEQGPLSVQQAVDHVLDIIDGLMPAHEAGIVHRDLKPANCFIDHEGRVKIGDFGLAKSYLGDSSLTRTGTFMGTPQFAAPEQLRASEVDEKADIYALGGTLFYLLTGRAPFEGNAAQVIASIASDRPPEIHALAEGVPRELGRVISQSLEKDPARRQQNLTELRSALVPFSTRGASQADLGRRMAAFFLDTIFCAVGVIIVSQMAGILGVLSGDLFTGDNFQRFSLINVFVQFGVLLAYFAIPEWKFGWTPGKWLMGMRVIDQHNEPPHLMAALIRAALVPGLSQLCVTLPSYFMNFAAPGNNDVASVMVGMIKLQGYQLLSLIPNLLLMSTARSSNAYRGVHDLITRTRVVRLRYARTSAITEEIPITAPMVADDRSTAPELDSLDIIGRFSDSANSAWLARDPSLQRHVWVLPLEDASANILTRGKLRPAQIRQLSHRQGPGGNWLVTEAVHGSPLLEFLKTARPLPWAVLLPVMRDLVLELIELDKNGEADNCRCDRIWINNAGQLKFIDGHVSLSQLADHPANPAPSARGGIDIIKTVLDATIARHVVPEHVLKFRGELDEMAADPEVLRLVEQRLEAMEDRASNWNWIERMGSLAASYGAEYSPLGSLLMAAALFIALRFSWPPEQVGLGFLFFGSLLTFLGGFVFRGGPVFRFLGISVRRNADLGPASRFRCGLRGWLSWLPVILMMSLFAMLMEYGMEEQRSAATTLETNAAPLMVVYGLVLVILFLVLFACLMYSIVRPARGISDLLCGTRLMRR